MENQKNNGEWIDLFNRLGISRPSAELYCSILTKGRVLKESIIGDPEIIDELKIAGFLHIDMDAIGKEYIMAVEPEIAINSQYTKKLWEYEPEEGWVYSGHISTKAVEKLYRIKTNLISRLKHCYANNYESEHDIKIISEGFSSNAMSIALKQARIEILGMTSPPWLSNISLVWETIKDRISNGITYRRLSDEITLIAFGHQINIRDVFEVGVKLVVLLGEAFEEKFFVIDKNEAFIFVPCGPDEGFKLELMQARFRPTVSMYRDKFEKLWKKGVEGESIIDFMNELRDDFLDRSSIGLKADEKKVLNGLFDYGIFFKRKYIKIEQERLDALLKNLESRGYLFPYSGAELGYLPNVLDELRDYIAKNQQN